MLSISDTLKKSRTVKVELQEETTVALYKKFC